MCRQHQIVCLLSYQCCVTNPLQKTRMSLSLESWWPILINVRNSSCGKVMFLHLSVILFMGWGCLGRHLPSADTPQADSPPPEHTTPRQTHPPWHPPGRHPPGRHLLPETATAADGKHPTGMHSCLKYFIIFFIFFFS